MARTDLTEAEIRTLQRRSRNVLEDGFVWNLTRREADQIQRLAGEVVQLRETQAQVQHLAGQEQEW